MALVVERGWKRDMSETEFENLLERVQVLESDLDEVYERLDELEGDEDEAEDEQPANSDE